MTPSPPGSTFRIEIDMEQRRVRLRGEFDLATAGSLDDLVQLCSGWPGLVVDLSAVSFMDVIGLRHLLALRAALEPDATLVLRRPQPIVRRLIDVLSIADDPGFLVLDELADRGDGPGAWSRFAAVAEHNRSLNREVGLTLALTADSLAMLRAGRKVLMESRAASARDAAAIHG